MTDDLAIRMAVILSREMPDVECPMILDAVDVLIRELGMEREHWQYGDGHTMGVRSRYVTEWTTDDYMA